MCRGPLGLSETLKPVFRWWPLWGKNFGLFSWRMSCYLSHEKHHSSFFKGSIFLFLWRTSCFALQHFRLSWRHHRHTIHIRCLGQALYASWRVEIYWSMYTHMYLYISTRPRHQSVRCQKMIQQRTIQQLLTPPPPNQRWWLFSLVHERGGEALHDFRAGQTPSVMCTSGSVRFMGFNATRDSSLFHVLPPQEGEHIVFAQFLLFIRYFSFPQSAP